MDAYGYHFYGNEQQTQGELIDWINAEFDPPIEQIEDGMCYMLAMQFLLDYLRGQRGATPEHTFDHLTGDKVYLRQIAGNYREYIEHGFPSEEIETLTPHYIELLSYGKLEAAEAFRFYPGTSYNPSLDSPAKGHLVVFYFEEGGETYGHAVAVVRVGDTYCLYDPNYGIFRIDDPKRIYTQVLPDIYCPAGIHGMAFTVNKRKED